MGKGKYLPDEIDRMIDEEISRIDAANSAAPSASVPQRDGSERSPVRKIYDFIRSICRCRKPISQE